MTKIKNTVSVLLLLLSALFVFNSCEDSTYATRIHLRNISFLQEEYQKSVNNLKQKAEEQPGEAYLNISNKLDTLIKYYMLDLDTLVFKNDLEMPDIQRENKKFFDAADLVLSTTRFLPEDTIGLRYIADSLMLYPECDSLEFILVSKELCLEKAIHINNVLRACIGTQADYFLSRYDIGFRLQVNQKKDTVNLELKFVDPRDKQTFKKVEYIGIADEKDSLLTPMIYKNISDNSSVRLKLKPLPAGKYLMNYTTFEMRNDGSEHEKKCKSEFMIY